MSQLSISSFVVISELQNKNQRGKNIFFRFYRIYRIYRKFFEKLRIFDKFFGKKKFEKNGHSSRYQRRLDFLKQTSSAP
jgi:hypothetical protein